MEEQSISFEEGMEKLQELVTSLEQGEMKLEESFTAFEAARALEKKLRAMLDECDRRIRVLTDEGEHPLEGEQEE